MPKFFVELSARLYWDGEVDAEDEAAAIDQAWELADDDVMWNPIDWDVDYVEDLTEPEAETIDPNQGRLL